MKVAIMQPYVFPYIGYFQLIAAVDVFVFYDDVNFIKKGYIHRNHLLFNDKKTRFTISCKGISQNKKINEIVLDSKSAVLKKLLLSIEQHYKQAPFFKTIMPLLKSFFESVSPNTSISQFAISSIEMVSEYLGLTTVFEVSSEKHAHTIDLGREARLIAITKNLGGVDYVNAIGGQDLYSTTSFKKEGVNLYFLKPEALPYPQFHNEFVPWLSIIDVLMFNSKATIHSLLNAYTLE